MRSKAASCNRNFKPNAFAIDWYVISSCLMKVELAFGEIDRGGLMIDIDDNGQVC